MALTVFVAVVKIVPSVISALNEWVRARAADRIEEKRTRNQLDDAQWTRLHGEIERLAGRVEALETKCDHLTKKVDECEQEREAAVRRAIAAEAETARLKAEQIGLGIGRQQAQAVVSADRMEQARERKG